MRDFLFFLVSCSWDSSGSAAVSNKRTNEKLRLSPPFLSIHPLYKLPFLIYTICKCASLIQNQTNVLFPVPLYQLPFSRSTNTSFYKKKKVFQSHLIGKGFSVYIFQILHLNMNKVKFTILIEDTNVIIHKISTM